MSRRTPTDRRFHLWAACWALGCSGAVAGALHLFGLVR